MTMVTVPMVVQMDIGGLFVILIVLQIVKNQTVTAKLDNVSAVGLVIGERRVIHNARCIVLKESVTKAMGTVKRDALRDSMETRVITHVVLGVKEGHVTNRVEPAMLDANRTLQGVSVMVRTPIKFLIFF